MATWTRSHDPRPGFRARLLAPWGVGSCVGARAGWVSGDDPPGCSQLPSMTDAMQGSGGGAVADSTPASKACERAGVVAGHCVAGRRTRGIAERVEGSAVARSASSVVESCETPL